MPGRETPPPDVTIEREAAEAALEEGLEGTFPASDPIAIVQPGHRVGSRDDLPPEPRPGLGPRGRDRAR